MQHILGAIYNRLINDTTLQGLVGQRIYIGAPYPDATLPAAFIVPTEFEDVRAMNVRAVARGGLYVYAVTAGNAQVAQQAADRIDVLLHNWSDPPAIWAVVRERMVFDLDQVNRRTVVTRGALYDVIAAPA